MNRRGTTAMEYLVVALITSILGLAPAQPASSGLATTASITLPTHPDRATPAPEAAEDRALVAIPAPQGHKADSEEIQGLYRALASPGPAPSEEPVGDAPPESAKPAEPPPAPAELAAVASPSASPEALPALDPEPAPTPSVAAPPEPTPAPSVEAAPEPTPAPSVAASPEPTPAPSVEAAPEPTPAPSVAATPQLAPTPSVEASPEPAPAPSVLASPTPAPVVPNLDPALVGTWESTFTTDQGPWTWTLLIRPDGTFLFTSKGPIPLPEDTGTFIAGDGKFRRASQSGREASGTYTLVGETLTLVAPDYTQTWRLRSR